MKKILITDDEAMNLKMAEFILKKAGYMTETASSGDECINAVKADKPDLILLDLLMPEKDGFETLEMLRSLDGGRDIPVIMFTAAEDGSTLEKISEADIFACVSKPIQKDVLLEKVIAAIGS